MPVTNDFLPFAVGGGANVITQAQYAALTTLLSNGFASGTALSNQLNKIWRQSSIMSSVLAQAIADITQQNTVDDGTTATLLSNLKKTIHGTVTSIAFAQSPATLTLANVGLILVNASGGNVVINHPAANALASVEFRYVRTDTTANTVTIQRQGSDVFRLNGTQVTSILLPAFYTAGVKSDGTSEWEVIGGSVATPIRREVRSITATPTTNTMVVGFVAPDAVDFRNSAIGNGAPVTRIISSNLSLTIPQNATLGSINAVQSKIMVLLIDSAGTPELAVVNVAGGNNLDETTVINTTAISGTATAANVIYSTTARTGVAFRVVGYFESTQATAGTWATAPTTIQGVGGNAGSAMQSIGYGQTWQNLTASRVMGTTYYNTTGRTIFATFSGTTTNGSATLTVNGITISGPNVGNNLAVNVNVGPVAIPPGASYVGAGVTLTAWQELR